MYVTMTIYCAAAGKTKRNDEKLNALNIIDKNVGLITKNQTKLK